MSNYSQIQQYGYVCPVKGCKHKKHRYSIFGLCMHIRDIHGEEELAKRLNTKEKGK